MSLFKKKSRILVTCPKAMPDFLAEEMEALGFEITKKSIASVETEGTMRDCMRLNLHLRIGHRVLYLLKTFRAAGPDELYKEVSKVGWEDIIDSRGYVSITSSVLNDNIRDTRFANLRLKDAVVDRISSKRGRRPDSGPILNKTVIFLHWRNGGCALYIDSSGEALSKRGYRLNPMKAPMQETLAAACVEVSGWDGTKNFVNPMCGSGTLAIEAAMRGLNMAPGLIRRNFGFMHILDYDEREWKRMRGDALSAVRKGFDGRIIATDINSEAVEAAKSNAAEAGVERFIEFGKVPFEETEIPGGETVVMLNPEYGMRMGEVSKLEKVYGEIGDFFKQSCTGCSAYIFTGNMDLAKKVGLKTSSKTVFWNSKIECRLLGYEIYSGSKKNKD
ncbi:THUMP domain-containing class I SAM-dependent RNA methyltransferase [Limisalsivibrio acetivorans]|uniref:THUMP domain-containing class I SAM-dependent RNA methyltransferase n=1 Tax=Limisalsivibrio acetivorans TaxID=1304888 RepID=UPI0003B3453E|nr:class I SAM-dependent RNA methyltransferase [Limisalsivibrio acetivorans]